MENQQANVSGVNRSVVSIGTAGPITNHVSDPSRGGHAATLSDLLTDLARLLPEIPLRPGEVAEIEAEIRTVQAQLGSPRPRRAVVQESVRAIRGLLQGVAENPAHARLRDLIGRIVTE